MVNKVSKILGKTFLKLIFKADYGKLYIGGWGDERKVRGFKREARKLVDSFNSILAINICICELLLGNSRDNNRYNSITTHSFVFNRCMGFKEKGFINSSGYRSFVSIL